ncbi:hypothetical protein [Flavobacterium sp.]|uniref:hypothetical protein n=1 Tax=Flavobacterium sp. TaxID=239 RepID=UPI00286A2E32|nr:hypothetical protein [Flavobacterium sp.]
MKKIVLVVALTFGSIFTSCNKKVETSSDIDTTEEQMAQKDLDSLENDTIAPMVQPKDSISKY